MFRRRTRGAGTGAGAPVTVLFVPGLARGPAALGDDLSPPGPGAVRASTPTLPALGTLLAAATPVAVPVAGETATLLHLFGLPDAVAGAAAGAAYCRMGEDTPPESGSRGWWLRADPVHLEADRDALVLRPGVVPTAAEAGAMADGLNRELFGPAGMALEVCAPGRWYLSLSGDPRIRTVPPGEPEAAAAAPGLPQGPGARCWRRLLNEAQMLLHADPANATRVRNGLPPVNSLWFWGAGTAAALPERRGRVFGGGALGRGLARCAGVPHHPSVAAAAHDALATDPGEWYLIVCGALRAAWERGDRQAQAAALDALERDWFVPLCTRLRAERGLQVRLYTGDGRAWVLGRPGRWLREAARRRALDEFFLINQ